MTGGMIRGQCNIPATTMGGLAMAALLVMTPAPGHAADAISPDATSPGPTAADTATISVSADATASVTPDRARLRFAVETEADSASAATRRNAELTSAAIAAVRALVGEGDQVSTSGFSVMPVYSREGDREVVAYRATNSLIVTLTDTELVGSVIDAAVGAGANRVDGLEFFAAESEDAYRDALARAVERAMAEAEVMANAAGGTLGRVVSLQSNSSGQPVARVMAESLQMADTPIEPGAQTIGASVRLEIQLLGR